MPTTVAARRGFGDRERNMMYGDRRLEGIGRTAGSRPEGWRYEVGEFGGGGKIRVRKEKERELGELSSGSEADSPTAGVAGVAFHWPASVTVARKRGSASAALVGENGKKARVTCRGDAVVVDGPISQCHPIFSGRFECVNVCRRLENVAPGDSDDSPDASICCKSDHLDEEGEVFITRNISLSRWASEDNISEGEESFGRKKGAPSTLKNSLGRSMKLPTPTIAERSRDRSDDVTSSLLGSGSEHDCRELEKGRTDHMDLDAEDSDLDINNSESDVEVDLEEILAESPEHVCPQRKSINMLQCCQSVNNFERLNRISEGTYGVVYRARDKKTGEILALKQVKMAKEREGFPLTALREINILLSLNHPSIIDIKEVVVGDSPDKIYLVMEYMDHDLKVLMESMKQPFSQSEVKCLMLQLLEGVCYLHDNWVLHRDLKTSNLLFNNRGELKICDFGLSRQYGSPLKPYTPLVVTLWYRAPELLLGAKQYSTAVDMWSLGCIMAELLSKEPLFNGKTEVDQLDKIFKILGVPNEKIWPGFADLPRVKGNNFVKQPYNRLREKFPPTSFIGRPTLSERGFDLLTRLLTYDPEKRITAEAALRHEWFMEVPLPKSKDFMPTFPAKHAQEAFTKKMNESRHLDGLRRKELQPAWEMNNHSRPSLIEDCPDLLGGDFFTLSWKELSCRILVSQVRECAIYIEV